MAPRIVANILCHNDLIYLKNLIPQVEKFADRIIVVDDCSTDGTREYLRNFPIVERVEHKFNLNFSDQRNIALEMVDNGDWVFRIDSDECPSDSVVNNLREILHHLQLLNIDRLTIPIFHLTNIAMCKLCMGVEIRLFQKNDTCVYLDKIHERIHGVFPGHQNELPEQHCLVHFKHADKNKMHITKTFYVDNDLYRIGDLKKRDEEKSTFLPPFVTYSITEELKSYLCTNPLSKIRE